MIISMIAAMGENRELGLDNELLWRLPVDMKFFRETTMGKPILVGRKTYESFGGKPLPGRKNIVITQDESYRSEGAIIVHNIDDALAAAQDAEEIMIIGGASFYQQLLPRADRMYLTYVHQTFAADSWFPEFNQDEWQEISRRDNPADEKNPYSCTFVVFERKAY